jgi:hypothetical protein
MSNKTLVKPDVHPNAAFRQTPPHRPTPMPVQEIAVWTPASLMKSAFAGCMRLFVSRDVETSRAE